MKFLPIRCRVYLDLTMIKNGHKCHWCLEVDEHVEWAALFSALGVRGGYYQMGLPGGS